MIQMNLSSFSPNPGGVFSYEGGVFNPTAAETFARRILPALASRDKHQFILHLDVAVASNWLKSVKGFGYQIDIVANAMYRDAFKSAGPKITLSDPKTVYLVLSKFDTETNLMTVLEFIADDYFCEEDLFRMDQLQNWFNLAVDGGSVDEYAANAIYAVNLHSNVNLRYNVYQAALPSLGPEDFNYEGSFEYCLNGLDIHTNDNCLIEELICHSTSTSV